MNSNLLKKLKVVAENINIDDFQSDNKNEYNSALKKTKDLITQNFEKWVNFHNMLYPPKKYKNKIILDLGFGLGFFPILASLQGAKFVYAVETGKNKINALNQIAKKFKLNIKALNIHFDTDTEFLVNQPLDLITGTYVLEHLKSEQRKNLFRVAHKNLKKGGCLLLVTHNTERTKQLEAAKAVWREREENFLLPTRKNMILESFPDLKKDSINALAEACYGLNKEEIIQASKEFIITSNLPKKREGAAVNPLNNIIIEDLINPAEIKKDLKNAGFNAYVSLKFYSSKTILRKFHSLFYYLPYFIFKNISKSVTFKGVKK